MYFVFKFYLRFYTILINIENLLYKVDIVHIVVIRAHGTLAYTYVLKYFWVVYLNTYSLPRVFPRAITSMCGDHLSASIK